MNSPSSSPSHEPALVTDTACSLGHELARELARHGHDLVLVEAIEPDLLGTASRIQAEFGVNVRPVALDLRKPSSADELFALLTATGVNPEILVNVSGDKRLTQRFLPAMVARGHGRILELERADTAPDADRPDASGKLLVRADASAPEETGTGVTLTVIRSDPDAQPSGLEPATPLTSSLPTPQEIAAAAYVALIQGEPLLVPARTPATREIVPTDAPSEPALIPAAA